MFQRVYYDLDFKKMHQNNSHNFDQTSAKGGGGTGGFGERPNLCMFFFKPSLSNSLKSQIFNIYNQC